MSRFPRQPIFLLDPHPPGHVVRLPVVPDAHLEKSRAAILHVAQEARKKTALVLGAGRCEEIPLAELAALFSQVTLVDEDAGALAAAPPLAALDDDAKSRVTSEVADLTGAAELLERQFAARLASLPLATLDGFEPWLEELANFLATSDLPALLSPTPADLIVASCVLSQLHLTALHASLEQIAKAIDPSIREEALRRIRGSSVWMTACWQFARRLEHRFVDEFAARLSTGAVAYFSDTVQLCYVRREADNEWSTPGMLRMTEHAQVSQYFDERFDVQRLGEWAWVVDPPGGPDDVGRVYRVQAVQLKCRAG